MNRYFLTIEVNMDKTNVIDEHIGIIDINKFSSWFMSKLALYLRSDLAFVMKSFEKVVLDLRTLMLHTKTLRFVCLFFKIIF